MASLQNFYTSRDNNANANTYVGQLDRLWYNPNLNSIYVSDGNTPGGIPVGLATGANAIFTNITVNGSVTGNLVISGNISPAATNKIGGIIPGPGVDVSNTGLLTIDSANLPVSFGNFFANNNILSIVNDNEDMILSTQGSAEIQLIGNVGFYKPDGLPPNTSNRYAFFNKDGQITILVPTADPTRGAVNIIGSLSGQSVEPVNAGVMLHITGNNDDFATQYIDGVNNFSNYIGRRYNGLASAPTAVRAGNVIARFSGVGYGATTFGTSATASLSYVALENFTDSAQGTQMQLLVAPIGSVTRQLVASIDVANGVSATKFTTTGNISATGNITGGNLILSTGGLVSSTGLITTTGNISAGNVNSYVVLPAGTATKAPLTFSIGNILSPAITGSMEYDGRLFYTTPQDQERGLLKTQQTYILNTDYALTNQTAGQSLFGVSAGVSSNTRYVYVINALIYKSANNINMSYALQGNAVLSRHTYQTITTASSTLATLSTPSVLKNILTTGFDTPVVVTAALNSTGYYSLQVTGIVNVTTGGTWNPLIAFSGLPGVGSYVAAGSSVEIYPVGVGNSTVSVGNWT